MMEELIRENTRIAENHDMDREVKLISGETAMQLLKDPEFLRKWKKLYVDCLWATAFQSPGFVNSWYTTFLDEYFPVVVYQMGDERLEGLLCMAIPHSGEKITNKITKSHRIVGAGEFEAEYQVWLSRFQNGDFITKAIDLLHRNYPKGNLQFRFIPSNAPMEWLEKSGLSKNSVLQKFKRPLLDYSMAESKNAFKINKQYKTKLNRLKREGSVVFERLEKESEFVSVLDELAVQYDFRQGGMFNKNQFRDNPRRKDFLLALFRQKVLHVTILRVDCKIIGSVGAVYGKKWLHLQGLNTHSPFVARHSPGILHFYHLGKHLQQEGFQFFDLTPGGDKYKEKFATTHDEVYTLCISENKLFLAKKYFKKKFSQILIKRGIVPMSFEVQQQKRIYLLKHKLSVLKHKFFSANASSQRVIKPEEVALAPACSYDIQKNNLKEILDFNDPGFDISRWQYLENAMMAFERGQSVFTLSHKNKLLAAVWVVDSEDKFAQDFPDGFTLHQPYVHPDGMKEFYPFIRSVKDKLQQENPKKPIQVSLANGFANLS